MKGCDRADIPFDDRGNKRLRIPIDPCERGAGNLAFHIPRSDLPSQKIAALT